MSPKSTFTADKRLCDVPHRLLSGYIAGLLAGDEAATVTFLDEVRSHDPIAISPDRSTLTRQRGGRWCVAARKSPLLMDLVEQYPSPILPALEEILKARPITDDEHPAPYCYACGFANERGTHIRFRTMSDGVTAAGVWWPNDDLATPKTHDSTAVMWAVLGCACHWGARHGGRRGAHLTTTSISGVVLAPAVPGRAHIVVSWPLTYARHASESVGLLYGPGGDLCAVVHQRTVRNSWATRSSFDSFAA